ncbi:INO80 complex subunit C-like [Phodopus roborovskii]|uniref:INO80 complex subunit C-like n=1 Tax=Phodopus roborovskii TaxID=109678 RepID=UPI0021E505AB|nr:INO80 complex subunit C-like [Phodopus roborovskii]
MAAQIPIVAATSTPTIARTSKKRPASPSHNGSGGGYGASKKKKLSAFSFPQGVSIEAMSENKMASSEFSSGPVEKAAKQLPFKDPNFVHSDQGGAVAGKKNRTWKNLKQILAAERALPWQLAVHMQTNSHSYKENIFFKLYFLLKTTLISKLL